ncbi:type II toxin-antitoxin system VapC family toxin [Candidatus Poribacteria bacterium]|nr:type II toxin-antitoxin system VapC family toxin [Candidatus Poribacteria bacterium]
MNSFYFDASGLAKRYSSEVGTPLVNYLFANVTSNRMMCLTIGACEVVWIFVRKKNRGDITSTAFNQAIVDFQTEVINAAGFTLISAEDELVIASFDLIEEHSINSTDAILLNSALNIAADLRRAGNDLVVVAADERLLRAARAEGLETFNPEKNSQADLDALLSHA